MKSEQIRALKPGDRVWWWFDTGIGATQVPFTVVRVNSRTVTVLNGWDEHIRVSHETIEGLVDWEDQS